MVTQQLYGDEQELPLEGITPRDLTEGEIAAMLAQEDHTTSPEEVQAAFAKARETVTLLSNEGICCNIHANRLRRRRYSSESNDDQYEEKVTVYYHRGNGDFTARIDDLYGDYGSRYESYGEISWVELMALFYAARDSFPYAEATRHIAHVIQRQINYCREVVNRSTNVPRLYPPYPSAALGFEPTGESFARNPVLDELDREKIAFLDQLTHEIRMYTQNPRDVATGI